MTRSTFKELGSSVQHHHHVIRGAHASLQITQLALQDVQRLPYNILDLGLMVESRAEQSKEEAAAEEEAVWQRQGPDTDACVLPLIPPALPCPAATTGPISVSQPPPVTPPHITMHAQALAGSTGGQARRALLH